MSPSRIFNFAAIALVLGVIYTMSLASNTAQETNPATENQEKAPVVAAPAEPQSAAAEQKAAEQPAEAQEKAPAVVPVEKPVETPETQEKTSESTGPAFPVIEPESGTPASFADIVPEGEAAKEKVEATEKKSTPKVPFTRTSTFTWLVFLVITLGCFFAGNYLAQYWRLPDHNVRIFVLLLAFFGSFAAVYLGWHRLTLGIDLQGGVVLVYDAVPIQRGGEGSGPDASATDGGLNMDQLARAITKRINPGGVREISITKLGQRQIQVIIPRAEDAEVARIERIISESGALTFRIVASRLYPQDASIIERAQKEQGREIRDSSGVLEAQWVPVFESEADSFRNNPDIVTRDRRGHLEVLVLFNDRENVTGEYLTYVGRGMDNEGQPGVSFGFNSKGENKFRRLTSANRPDPAQPNRLKRQLGIILNDSLYSAPSINQTIGASGIISFGRRHTEAERMQLTKDIDDLIAILDAGALPADLSKEPVSRLLIGATLGVDTIQKGKVALIASAIVVLVFMVIYYRLAGLIACFCVVTNISLLVAIMLVLRAAFTLPGLAGIVLTIGMAVDANILIYERLREELAGGSSLKMAIRNAYAKAFSAIFDSNITTMLTGIILYAVGTEQVKGFAVTLVLGVGLSMFTAIYCARTIMDIFEVQKGIRTFRMLQLFKRPNINFLGAKNACAVFSIVLVVISLVAVVARGKGIFDIDFVGGVSVEAVFKESQDIGQIRSRLYEKDKTIDDIANKLNDLAVQNVQLNLGEAGTVDEALAKSGKSLENTHFIITTSIPQIKDGEVSPEQYLQTVRNILKDTFGDSLVYSKFDHTIGETTKIGETDQTVVQLKLYPSMNYESLRSALGAAVQKAMQEKKIENDFAYTIAANDKSFVEGTQKSFDEWTLTAHTTKEILGTVLGPLKAETDGTPYFPTSTTVGGSVAKDTRIAGMLAVLGSLVCIVLYIWLRFQKLVYGIAAVIGLLHDVVIVLGLIALSYWIATPLAFLQVEEFKIGLPVVAAFLTIIGYSLNDTIILFDRIRENKGKSQVLTDVMINNSVNQTLSRTVLTSLTTLFVAVILYFWGGQGIHTFAFAMSAGILFGTYSTIGLCAPILFWMVGVEAEKKAITKSEI